ncbi:hypothetical protein M8C21_018590, partial [Ambrosia artemisiifolia]
QYWKSKIEKHDGKVANHIIATPEQSTAIMDLIESRWEELVGDMPVKVCYPAIEGQFESPGLQNVTKLIDVGRPQIAGRAIEVAELRFAKDGWPEYYDGKSGRYIGKHSNRLASIKHGLLRLVCRKGCMIE